jgi:acetyl-CoA acyltransferase
MRQAVIVNALRTPVGRRGGGLGERHPVELSADLLGALVPGVGVDPKVVDDVVWGCVHQVGEQTYNVARNAVIAAGWPSSVPGQTVDRQCGSSQQAVHTAAAMIVSGQADVVVAGGVEVMTMVPMGSSLLGKDPFSDRFAEHAGGRPHMGLGAEMIAERWNLDRQALDAYALRSHERAAAAQDAGHFEREILPVDGKDGVKVTADEGVRRGGTLESLGGLRTVFKEGGRLTAASSSQISDGAAGLLLMTPERAEEYGLRPLARVHTAVVAGDDPILSLTALIPATARAFERSGLSISDIGTFEVSEAFASVPLAWLAETGADDTLVNPDGGAISIGHPLGGSGARLMTTLVHRMQRDQIRYGLQAMCEGGGLSNATILELL